MRRWLIWTPLILSALTLGIALYGMRAPQSTIVKSRMVGKAVPEFALPAIVAGKPGLSSTALTAGKPRLINVFASWCVPCAAESPQLARLTQAGATIDAIAVRDDEAAVRRFLTRNGDPFSAIGDDRTRRVQLSLGSSGVPETFVVDGQGMIVAQHIGPIRDEDVPDILAALEQAR